MRRCLVFLIALSASTTFARANLITNGDFNSGLTGWSTVNPSGAATSIEHHTTDGNPAPSAQLLRVDTSAFTNKDILYQAVPVTPGEDYILNAHWRGDLQAGGNNRNWAEVLVGFFPTATLTDADFADTLIRYKKRWDPSSGTLNVDQSTGAWAWESILSSPDTSGTAGPADGVFTATDEYMVVGFNIGGRAGAGPANYLVDNASITLVPEPGAIALLSVGGLALLRRRRQVRVGA